VVRITIPRNAGGKGYVCYGLPTHVTPFTPNPVPTTQDYEGAEDLDIKPVMDGQQIEVCRVFPEASTSIHVQFQVNTAEWTPASDVTVTITAGDGTVLGARKLDNSTGGKAAFSADVKQKTGHTLSVRATQMPPQNRMPTYTLALTYTAPQMF
jgi:hypothetical protein